MGRRIRRALLGLCGLVLAIAMAGFTYQWLATRREIAATPPPGRLVDVGGYRLHLWCTGDGSPAVILDAGLAGTTAGWGFVLHVHDRGERGGDGKRAVTFTAVVTAWKSSSDSAGPVDGRPFTAASTEGRQCQNNPARGRLPGLPYED